MGRLLRQLGWESGARVLEQSTPLGSLSHLYNEGLGLGNSSK